MKKKYNNSIFVFRRDLRLNDNTGLISALHESKQVIPIFIFDPNQISSKNKFRSLKSIQFMIESIKDLQKKLKSKKSNLYLFHGFPEKIIEKVIKNTSIDAVYLNRDYTPYSQKRDKTIEKICKKNNIVFEMHNDLLINEPEEVYTSNKTPYQIFTPFYKKSSKLKIEKPTQNKFTNYFNKSLKETVNKKFIEEILPKKIKDIYVSGGRSNCSKIINNLKNFKDYKKTRDIPSIDTTLLSAHLKFGTYSVREVISEIKKQLGKDHMLIRQLYWRDFFTHVAYHFPHVFGSSFHKKYNNLPWKNNKKLFKSWCEGKTGFPIVDAGMRQLNKTGFMHNRVRMIVASFLVKDLHINWLWGEKYFAQNLVDYDPSLNNGNWQWSASTGCDAQPYFRIFNPWLQQKKFDPKCLYIKKWIPELKTIDNKIIHNWFKQKESINKYPIPIVDHKKESKLAKQYFKKVS